MGRVNRKQLNVLLGLVLAVVLLPLLVLQANNACAAEKKVLKLGTMTAFTLKEGLEIKKWNDLFAKMENEKGGIQVGNEKYELQWNTYDVGVFDASKQQPALEKAIFQDHCTVLLNGYGENPTITAATADQNKVIALVVGFNDEIVGPKYQYVFRPNGGFFGRAMNYAIMQDFRKAGGKVYVVSTGDSEDGKISAAQYGAAASLAGLKVLPPVFFAGDTVDFGPVATKILSMKADVVDLCVTMGPQVTSIITALRDVGWKGKIFPGAGLGKDTLANVVKKTGSFFDGSGMLYFDPRGIPVVMQNPEMKALLDRYTKEYGEFQTEGCFWVGAWFILRDAIKNAKSVDINALKQYLEKGPPGVLTMVGYTQLFARPDLNQMRTVDAAPGHGIGVVEHGQLRFTSQITMQDQYLVSLKSYSMTDKYKGILDTYQKYWDKYGRPKFPAPEQKLNRFTWDDLKK